MTNSSHRLRRLEQARNGGLEAPECVTKCGSAHARFVNNNLHGAVLQGCSIATTRRALPNATMQSSFGPLYELSVGETRGLCRIDYSCDCCDIVWLKPPKWDACLNCTGDLLPSEWHDSQFDFEEALEDTGNARMMTYDYRLPFAAFMLKDSAWISGEACHAEEDKEGFRFLTSSPLELSDLGRPIFDELGFVVEFVWDVATP